MRTARTFLGALTLGALCVASVAAQVRSASGLQGIRRPVVAAETETHTITGIEAWSVARVHGFEFRPRSRGEQWVTYPYDGVDTRLHVTEFTGVLGVGITDTLTLARIVGGNLLVDRPASGSRSVTFSLFGGRRLADGWTVEDVQLRGATWKTHPEGNDLHIEVEATAYANRPASARVTSVTLRGPAGQPWSAAFEGRKTFTITGIEAWVTAKNYGYEFQPLAEYEDEHVSDALDGTDTYLIRRNGDCGGRPLATVRGGVMIVECPYVIDEGNGRPASQTYDDTRDFRLFGGKPLAPGWIVREVEATGGSWVARPEAGARSLELVYRLMTNWVSVTASGHITRVVLEGPASASTWEDAFKVN